MNDFYDWLQKIRKRPSMYLGQASISHLRSFIAGYILARRELKLPQSESEQKFTEFQPWLQQKFRLTSSQSWDKIILFYSEDERSALNYFFELLDQFWQTDFNGSSTLNDSARAGFYGVETTSELTIHRASYGDEG
jgi:hypothetical protein